MKKKENSLIITILFGNSIFGFDKVTLLLFLAGYTVLPVNFNTQEIL